MGATMKRRGIITILMAMVLATGVAGCGGGGAKAQTELTTTTVGQQLLDLQKAYEAGAISKEEYEKEKQKILSGK
jgi:ABC-type glycerol-3-phosphate transport system substrate-binding protein